MNNSKVFVVIPTYNERGNIASLLEEIFSLNLQNLSIQIVDDNSPDGTGELVEKIMRKYKGKLFVIHRPSKLGLGTAYVAGFKKAMEEGAEILLSMDADFFHNPKYIPSMLSKIGDFDLVIGSRYTSGGKITGFNAWRVIISSVAQFLSGFLLGLPARDSTSGFRVYKKEVIEGIKPHTIRSQGYSFLIEVLHRAHKMGFRIAEVPIIAPARIKGKSKISQKEIFNALDTVVRLALGKS